MRNNFFLKVVSIIFIILTIYFIGCNQGTGGSGGGETTTTTTVSSSTSGSSVAIMPTAVYSAAPKVTTQKPASGIIAFFKKIISAPQKVVMKSGAGFLEDPQTLNQIFMPIFTGLKVPKANEIVGDTSANWVGYYLGYPVLLKVFTPETDSSLTNPDPNKYKLVLKFVYYQDLNGNKKVDFSQTSANNDVIIGTVTILAYDDKAISGKWILQQSIKNSIGASKDQFDLTADGGYTEDSFNGKGTFTASSGNYRGKAYLKWSGFSDNSKVIMVEDGSINYVGKGNEEYFEVKDLNITIKVAPDGTSKITEGCKVKYVHLDKTSETIVKEATTTNKEDGTPDEFAYRIQITKNDDRGNIIESYTYSGQKDIGAVSFDENTGTTTYSMSDGGSTYIDSSLMGDDVKPGYLTIKASLIPAEAKGKQIKVFVIKSEDIDFVPDPVIGCFPKPAQGKTFATKMFGTVGSSLAIDLKSDSSLEAGYYFALVCVDINGDSDFTKRDTFNDDYMAFVYGLMINGDEVIEVGSATSGIPFIKVSDNGIVDGRLKIKTIVKLIDKEGKSLLDKGIKGKYIGVCITEVSPIGVDFDNPAAAGWFMIPQNQTSNEVVFEMIADRPIDFANKKYALAAMIDMDNDAMFSKGDYGYNSQSSGKYPIIKDLSGNDVAHVLYFEYQSQDVTPSGPENIMAPFSELNGNVPIPSSIPDANPFKSTISDCYDSSNSTGIKGNIDPSIYLDDAELWIATLEPIDPQTKQTYGIVAICKVDKSQRTFNFKYFKKDKQYLMSVTGYRWVNYDSNNNPILKPPMPDDWVLLRNYQINYGGTYTQTIQSPITFKFDGSKYIDMQNNQQATFKFDFKCQYGQISGGPIGDPNSINIGNGIKNIDYKIYYEKPEWNTIRRPGWLNSSSVRIEIYEKIPGGEIFISSFERSFIDMMNGNIIQTLFGRITGAQITSTYILKALQIVYDETQKQLIIKGKCEVEPAKPIAEIKLAEESVTVQDKTITVMLRSVPQSIYDKPVLVQIIKNYYDYNIQRAVASPLPDPKTIIAKDGASVSLTIPDYNPYDYSTWYHMYAYRDIDNNQELNWYTEAYCYGYIESESSVVIMDCWYDPNNPDDGNSTTTIPDNSTTTTTIPAPDQYKVDVTLDFSNFDTTVFDGDEVIYIGLFDKYNPNNMLEFTEEMTSSITNKKIGPISLEFSPMPGITEYIVKVFIDMNKNAMYPYYHPDTGDIAGKLDQGILNINALQTEYALTFVTFEQIGGGPQPPIPQIAQINQWVPYTYPAGADKMKLKFLALKGKEYNIYWDDGKAPNSGNYTLDIQVSLFYENGNPILLNTDEGYNPAGGLVSGIGYTNDFFVILEITPVTPGDMGTFAIKIEEANNP